MLRLSLPLLLTLHAGLLAAQPADSGPLNLGTLALHNVYSDHPLVLAVRAQGFLGILDREKLLDKRFPTDRVWAVLDAIGPVNVARHAVDAFVTQGLQARLAIGPSGALQPRDIEVSQLDARQAFVLGWLRAVAAQGDGGRLQRRSPRLSDAGALQLLEIAEKNAPTSQTLRAARLIAAVAADDGGTHACAHAVALATAARDGGQESLRLAAAERIDAIAQRLGAACRGREMAALSAPIQLPPPLPEFVPSARAASTQSQSASLPPPFVLAAPVFKGWLKDPLVRRLAGGASLDAAQLGEALQRDPTGDLAIAAINAAELAPRAVTGYAAEVVWAVIADRHAARGALPLAQLTPQEAVVYGYARAFAPPALVVGGDAPDARQVAASGLFTAAQSKLPSAATLGPLLALAHGIDVERTGNPCKIIDLADALRGVVQRANVPAAARQPLLQALDTVVGQCSRAGGRP